MNRCWRPRGSTARHGGSALRYVILPQMKVVIEFYVVVSVITMLSSVFSYVYIMGGGRGGPGTSTMVVELYIFSALVRTSLPGIASAVSVLLFLVSLLLIVPLFAVRRRANEEASTMAVTLRVDSAMSRTTLKHAVLLLATFIALVPTIFMIVTALKSDEEYTFNKVGFPQALVLDNFQNVLFESPFFNWMGNSLILAAGAVLLSTAVSASARSRSPGWSSRAGRCSSRSARR